MSCIDYTDAAYLIAIRKATVPNQLNSPPEDRVVELGHVFRCIGF